MTCRTPRTGFGFLDEPAAEGHLVAMAHRGGLVGAAAVENTLSAFRAAAGLGYRYLETDVHATRDGQLVAFHDPALGRVTGRPGAVAALSYAELADALVGGREPIPRLSDLMEELPEARFNVDVKTMAGVEPMVDLLRRTRTHERVCVTSFTESVIRRFRALAGPGVLTGCGVLTAAALATLPAGRLVARLLRDPGAVLQVPHRHRGLRIVDRAFVERAHRSGRHVHVWTVNDRAEMEQMIGLGVDGLITDRVELLKEVLLAHDLWEGEG